MPTPTDHQIQSIKTVLDNHVLIVALIACGVSQGLKLIIDVIKNGKISLRVLTTTGGMPSAHSAFVTALATGVGQVKGWDSVEFAIATIFAIIVMYDAAGVRQAAGKHPLHGEHPVWRVCGVVALRPGDHLGGNSRRRDLAGA